MEVTRAYSNLEWDDSTSQLPTPGPGNEVERVPPSMLLLPYQEIWTGPGPGYWNCTRSGGKRWQTRSEVSSWGYLHFVDDLWL